MDYCQDIVGVIEDYRYKDRRNNVLKIKINKNHVEKWVSQFDDHHEIILEETLSLLKSFYFSKEDIGKYLNGTFSNKKIWGEDIEKNISNTVFLDFQEKGESQHRLYKKAQKEIFSLYNLDIEKNRCDYGMNSYLYLDDCMFSGVTLTRDLSRLIDEVPHGSKIDIVFIIVHSFADWWVKKNLEEKIKEKNIELNIWRYKTINNSGGKNKKYDCLWPKFYESENVQEYIERMNEESENNPKKKVRQFRTDDYSGEIYISEKNREILEKQLMEAGLRIINFCDNTNQYMRPMGFDNRISFGFGAFFATYLNMSNNCPLAYWWGDATADEYHPFSKWYPLLPRKSNKNGGDGFEWL